MTGPSDIDEALEDLIRETIDLKRYISQSDVPETAKAHIMPVYHDLLGATKGFVELIKAAKLTIARYEIGINTTEDSSLPKMAAVPQQLEETPVLKRTSDDTPGQASDELLAKIDEIGRDQVAQKKGIDSINRSIKDMKHSIKDMRQSFKDVKQSINNLPLAIVDMLKTDGTKQSGTKPIIDDTLYQDFDDVSGEDDGEPTLPPPGTSGSPPRGPHSAMRSPARQDVSAVALAAGLGNAQKRQLISSSPSGSERPPKKKLSQGHDDSDILFTSGIASPGIADDETPVADESQADLDNDNAPIIDISSTSSSDTSALYADAQTTKQRIETMITQAEDYLDQLPSPLDEDHIRQCRTHHDNLIHTLDDIEHLSDLFNHDKLLLSIDLPDPTMSVDEIREEMSSNVDEMKNERMIAGQALFQVIEKWEGEQISLCGQSYTELQSLQALTSTYTSSTNIKLLTDAEKDFERALKQQDYYSKLVMDCHKYKDEPTSRTICSPAMLADFTKSHNRLKSLLSNQSQPAASQIPLQTAAVVPLSSLKPAASIVRLTSTIGNQRNLPTAALTRSTRSGRDSTMQATPSKPVPTGNDSERNNHLRAWRNALDLEQVESLLDTSEMPEDQLLGWKECWGRHIASHGKEVKRSAGDVAHEFDLYAFGSKRQKPLPTNLCVGGIGPRKELVAGESSTPWIQDCYLHGIEAETKNKKDWPCCYVEFVPVIQKPWSRNPKDQRAVDLPEDDFDKRRQVDSNGKRWVLKMRQLDPSRPSGNV